MVFSAQPVDDDTSDGSILLLRGSASHTTTDDAQRVHPFTHDVTAHFVNVHRGDGFTHVAIQKLPAGSYALFVPREDGSVARTNIVVAPSEGRLVLSPTRVAQARVTSVQRSGAELQVQMAGSAVAAGEVALPATLSRYASPEKVSHHRSRHDARANDEPAPSVAWFESPRCAYSSARRIGDEERYVLERQRRVGEGNEAATRPWVWLCSRSWTATQSST